MLCLFGNPDGHHRATSFSESLPSYHVIVPALLKPSTGRLTCRAFACPGQAQARATAAVFVASLEIEKPEGTEVKENPSSSACALANDRADSERMQS